MSLSSIRARLNERGRSCLFGRRDSYLHKGVTRRGGGRERGVSRSARRTIDTKSIINESTGRNDIVGARVLDPSGPVCSCWAPETGWLRSADDFPLEPPSPLHTNEFHGCWDSPVRWDELVSVHELAVSVEWRGGAREREGEIPNFSDLWFQIAFRLNVYSSTCSFFRVDLRNISRQFLNSLWIFLLGYYCAVFHFCENFSNQPFDSFFSFFLPFFSRIKMSRLKYWNSILVASKLFPI